MDGAHLCPWKFACRSASQFGAALDLNPVGPGKHQFQLPYRAESLHEKLSPNRPASRSDNYKSDRAGAREFEYKDYAGRRGNVPSDLPCAAKRNGKSPERDRATAKPLGSCR